jgi:hypothetical protein
MRAGGFMNPAALRFSSCCFSLDFVDLVTRTFGAEQDAGLALFRYAQAEVFTDKSVRLGTVEAILESRGLSLARYE